MSIVDAIYQKRYRFETEHGRCPKYLIMSVDVLTAMKREFSVCLAEIQACEESPWAFDGLIIATTEMSRVENYLEVV